jgi:hypothetical protein
MNDDRDLRNVILLLVKAVKLYKVRALTANTVLASLMALPPNKRAALTESYVQSEAMRISQAAEIGANKESAQIEKALSSEAAFLMALRVYASRQHWDS